MEKLKKAYEAIDILKDLGLPVSVDQLNQVAKMEKEYLHEEIIPLIKQELTPLLSDLKNGFNMELTYKTDTGLDITLVNRQVQERLFDDNIPSRRHKKYIIRVVFPDNRAVCSKMVWETLMEVVRYAGAEAVQSLNIRCMGENLVSPNLMENERYRVGQKEVSDGLYVNTYSSTDTKYEQIKAINRELNLGLRIEKVML